MNNWLTCVTTCVIVSLIPVVIFLVDWSFVSGEIVEYPIVCDGGTIYGNNCTSRWVNLNPTVYRPSVSSQEVLMTNKSTLSRETFTNCKVIDRKNWACFYDDESGVFGFSDGEYSEKWNVESEYTKSLEHTIFVSKARYTLNQFN